MEKKSKEKALNRTLQATKALTSLLLSKYGSLNAKKKIFTKR